MAQQAKATTAKPDSPSSIPGTHTVEGENWRHKLSSNFFLHMCGHTQTDVEMTLLPAKSFPGLEFAVGLWSSHYESPLIFFKII